MPSVSKKLVEPFDLYFIGSPPAAILINNNDRSKKHKKSYARA